MIPLNVALMRWTWKQNMTARRLGLVLGASALPFLAGLLILVDNLSSQGNVRYAGYDLFSPSFLDPVAYLILGGTVPFVAIVLVGGLVADETEDRTLTYLLSRPIARASLLWSKMVPTMALVAILAVVQVLGLWMTRMVALGILGEGAPSDILNDQGVFVGTMSDGLVLATQLPVALLACVLAGAAYTALFGLVTILTTKFHFLSNLGVLALLEWPFGSLGGQGLGVLTIRFHGLSLLSGLDPVGTRLAVDAAPWYLALVAIILIGLGWLALGLRRMNRRDFNIASAAT